MLSRRVRRHLDRQVGLGDDIRMCMRGRFNHSLILFGDRVIIVKPGVVAGISLGARVTMIYLRAVSGLQVRVGLINGTLEVTAPAYAKRRRDLPDRRGHRSANCIPFRSRRMKAYAPVLAALRTAIAEANVQTEARVQSPERILSELERLGALRLAGVLSQHEFERAKRLLLETSEAA